MKKSDNEFVAQGAAAWREKEEHLKVMKMLEAAVSFVVVTYQPIKS